MRVVAILLALAGLASACTCDAPPTTELVATEPAALEPGGPPQALGALPALTPMVTMAVHAGSFEVDNGALIDTWPAPDRARVESPHVHAEVAAAGGLLVPALRDAMQRAMDVERARAAGGGTPIAFALRVDGDAPWQRVQQAIYSAGQAGWVEPRFVLRAAQGEGEVVLAMPLPQHAPTPGESERLQRELASLLADLDGTPSDGEEAVADPGEPGIGPLVITLTRAHDLELRVRGEPLDGACARTGGESPTLPARDGAVDVAGLGRCVDTARATEPLAIGMLMLAADPALPFAEVAPVLETLRARAEVSLVAAAP